MVKNLALWIAALGLTAAACPAAHAQTITHESQLDAYLPRQAALEMLKKRIQADPNNKDNYLAYGKLAGQFGKGEEVAWAYERALAIDPTMDKVRLDLSLVYIALSRFDDARVLLNSVLKTNPPETVKQNISVVLAKIDAAQKRNHVTASLTFGVGVDTNANAAPNSVLIFDSPIALAGDAEPHSDQLAFAAFTLGNVYEVGNICQTVALRWKSSFNSYQTQQRQMAGLDLQLYGVRTGPEFIYTPLDLRFSVNAGYNYLLLHTQSYLRDPNVEVVAEMPLSGNLRVWAGSMIEYREFLNSNTNTTYAERAGQARQAQAGLRYALSDRSLWEMTGTLRHEDAKKAHYANDQFGVIVSNTYSFAPDVANGMLKDVFTVARAEYTEANYDEAQLLISSNPRKDDINSYQFTLGKKLSSNFIVSGSFAFTDAESNVENYRYINRRYLLSATRNF